MQDQEIDAQQCRILRQADEILRQQITNFASTATQERNNLNLLRSEMSKLIDELYKQEALRATAAIATGGRSLVSSAGGIITSEISDQIAILKSKINTLEIKISYSTAEVRRLQDKADLAANDLEKNAAEMRNLNCSA